MSEVANISNHHIGHRKRLREKFLNNPQSLADYEILEMILFSANPRKDTKPLAKSLLNNFGSLSKLVNAPLNKLLEYDGITEANASMIKLFHEAASRVLKEEVKQQPILNSWIKLLDYLKLNMGNKSKEQFRVLFLNTKNRLIEDEVQQEGTINHTQAYPREIVKRALELSAASVILVHNHPSGDPTPSRADIELTEQIIDAASTLGVNVHDHIIIAAAEHFSFKSNGLI